MINVQFVSKQFDDLEAVKNISLTVKKSSIYGLLGSNGAGKTTLLKIIAGIYKQDAGTILVENQPIFENIAMKQRMIFLPDTLFFYPHTTIKQMAAFYKSMYTKWSDERFKKLNEAFPIDINKKIHRMSKGMQRQVGFWLALSTMPDILLMDEPLDGLDAVMRQKIKNLLVQDVAEREMTIIISSHNLREVEDLCDHIGIIHHGEMMLEKELDDLKSDVHKLQIAFRETPKKEFLDGLSVLHYEKRGSVLICIVKGNKDEITDYVKQTNPAIFDVLPLTLEEIFIYEMGDAGYAIENIMV